VSRRRPQAADSLELLLDTLCNTFGGVLFIAMLVTVLLQMSGKGAASRPREPIDAEVLNDLADELEVLGRERDALLNELRANPPEWVDSDVPETRIEADLAEIESRLEDLERRRDAKLVETGRTDANALTLDEEAAAAKGRPGQLEREIEKLREQLAEIQRANSRIIRTPVVHTSKKRCLAIELRYDRLYLVHTYTAAGDRMGPNLDEYVLLAETDDGLVVTADPTRGVPIADQQTLSESLRKRLDRFAPSVWYLDLAVRSESFGSFHALQKASYDLGYEMRVLPLADSAEVSDRGRGGSGVQ